MVFSLTGLAFQVIETVLQTVGIPGLFALMFVESLGIPPLPSEIILPFAGLLIYDGVVGFLGIPFTWTTVLLAALGGGLTGALGGYLLGRVLGLPFLHSIGRRVGLEEEDLHRAERFFDRHGEPTVCFCRMFPIVRAYISYPAGAARMEPVRFSAFTVVGSVPFAVVLIYAGTILGKNFGELVPYFDVLDVIGVTALVVLAVIFLYRRRVRRLSDRSRPGPRAEVPPP